MDNKKFKILFGKIAQMNGFLYHQGYWAKESEECILVLDLQRSDYSNLYYLNIKLFIQGLFNRKYDLIKSLKREIGNIFIREPNTYSKYFDLENTITEEEREKGITLLFEQYLVPYSKNVESKSALQTFMKLNPNEIYLLPAVKEQLNL